MQNKTVREAAAAAGVKLWQIADALGCSDSHFSRKLRHEFDEAETEKVLAIIDKLKAKQAE